VRLAVGGLAAASILALGCSAQPVPRHLGYSTSAFERERALEQRFRDAVSIERFSTFHQQITRQPHMSGTAGAAAVAAFLQNALTESGLEVQLYEYRAYLSLPKSVAVDLVEPVAEPLTLTEPPTDLDSDTKHPDLLPGFVAYSASGDVTAPVVYANYGLPADYARLTALSVDVRGKLVIARYGRSHRAVKVHTAEQMGAAGLLIYSDPADDGFARGDTWPKGYWRTPELLQRGNAKYSWFWHGDPLTPGVAATFDAARLDPATAPTLPRIPAAVLSWGEARKILERLNGRAIPDFQGALPFSYHVDGGVRVRLRVEMDDALRLIRDVIATVPGARHADRGVLLGTHHDAWTFGGVDPGTGTAAMLELARGLGALRRGGWQPERSISIAFWDAEEFGLIGSTEYAEERRQALQAGTVCYINTDLYTNGRFDAGGVPSLRDVIVDVTKGIPEDTSTPLAAGQATVYDGWRRNATASDVELKSLGSGADFVPFQDYLGLPTLSLEFSATGGYTYGPYHSNYDTRQFVERVADPGFRRGAQLVRLLGSVALRLGEAQVLPFRFSHYAARLATFVETASTWTASANLQPLRAAVDRIAASASALERKIDDGLESRRLPSAATPRLNDMLARMEQLLLDDSEPADHGWYRHVVFGWDIYSLYDGQPFPKLAEAARAKDPERTRREIARIAAALERLEAGLRDALGSL